MNKPLRTLALGGFVSAALMQTSSAAQPDNLDMVSKDLRIMGNIFQTVMEEQGESSRSYFGQQPRALYLAGQGMVFSFNMSAMRGFFGEWGQQTRAAMQQVTSQLSVLSGDMARMLNDTFPDLDLDFDEDFDFDFDFDAVPDAPGAPVFSGRGGRGFSSAEREMLDELSDRIRDQEDRVQDVQRRMREAQRELRRSDSSAPGLESRVADLETELEPLMQDLQQKHEAYETLMEELQEQRLQRAEEINRQVTMAVIGGLCDYGATLRSLAGDEYVTLVFEQYQEDQSRVYVFPAAEVLSCSSSERLLEQASEYQM